MSELMSKMIQKDIDMLQDKIERLQKENESMKEELEELNHCGFANLKKANENIKKENDVLFKQNELLRNCLEFYAIEACNEDWCERYLPEHDRGIIDYLSGKLAKECLAKLGER